MTRTPSRWPLLIVVVVGLAASVSCRGGCRRGKDADVEAVVKGRLALFPIAARVVVSVEVARLRDSPAAGKLSTLVTEVTGRQGHARRVPAPHRPGSGEADLQHHARLPG